MSDIRVITDTRAIVILPTVANSGGGGGTGGSFLEMTQAAFGGITPSPLITYLISKDGGMERVYHGTRLVWQDTSVDPDIPIPVEDPPSMVTAPTITPSSGAVGTTFTFTNGTFTGKKPITLSGNLFLNGVDVTGDMNGNTYTSTAEGTLVWIVTATNSVGSTEGAPASAVIDPTLPSIVTAASISPGTGLAGSIFTLTDGVYSGSGSITLTKTLTLDGADVTANIINMTYSAPTEGSLVWKVVAKNKGGAVTSTASATVSGFVNTGEWLLRNGAWEDNGIWKDTSNWKDAA